MAQRVVCPCKNCFDKRTSGCWGTCKDYIEWKEQQEEKKRIEKQQLNPIITIGQFLGTSPKPGNRRK